MFSMLGFVIATPDLRLWVAVLFGISAELGEVSLESLGGINPIDIVVFALAATTVAGAGQASQAVNGSC